MFQSFIVFLIGVSLTTVVLNLLDIFDTEAVGKYEHNKREEYDKVTKLINKLCYGSVQKKGNSFICENDLIISKESVDGEYLEKADYMVVRQKGEELTSFLIKTHGDKRTEFMKAYKSLEKRSDELEKLSRLKKINDALRKVQL